MSRLNKWLKLRAGNIGWIQQLRLWLTFKMIGGGLPIELEVRHGAHRARVRQMWKGDMIYAEIPVGRPAASKEDQAFIDGFTAATPGTVPTCPTCKGKGFVE